jgi:hypothetical protein
MINKDFTLHPEALELKQLGFDEPCFTFYQVEYHENSPIMVDDNDQYRITGFRTCKNSEIPSHYISCPTYSQAFRWFREKYKLKCCIIPLVCEQGYSDLYESRIHQEKHSISRIGNYKIHEEAELACLKKLIEIVKEKQK